MKVGCCIFRDKFVYSNTDEHFHAKYKGRIINVTDVGSNKYGGRQYDCTVIGETNGIFDVDGYVDRFNIRDAIIWTLNGACLNGVCSN